ncbi:aminotransferase class I/II-fold pyridoxal phosphate-dependent enzyme [Nonomuraea roseoviolacea]|uniref:Arginine/lysine/ornithine decarboxylase n=1 Tax=Nonomuraea roseoviolacea subsp. carminata TaxID=160689 RepID=A0ABT1JXJ7_9ACTN|nr:aminotransferase class I/II-fold pyridoxal phosphate-dependent enzyme [Nonomuraea roseoviolacea]MCP2346493.1 arginine/lysine/ornithine decarboxylase [Nonomuraea roseoviolacea subsp. carminata]
MRAGKEGSRGPGTSTGATPGAEGDAGRRAGIEEHLEEPLTTDHSRAPVLEALEAYHRTGQTPFSPPGHKQGRGADPRVVEVLGEGVFRSDVLASAGLDDRSSSGGILEQAQELMADAVGAEHTFFSTCGSSLSVKAAMLAVAGPHEKLILGRDAHKSMVAGLILSGVEPIWVDPQWDAGLHLAHPPSVESFAEALAANPDAKGVLVTTPTPYGTCGDLEGLARLCHEHGKPLIVDEAWGAHFPFHPDLPIWAMDAGADLCVTSVHKMGSGLEQSSVFHLQGDLVDPAVLKARADLLSTTSASVLVYAALDGWRRQMVEHGRALYDRTLALAEKVRAAVEGIDGLHVYGRDEFVGSGLATDMDPLQVIIDVSGHLPPGYAMHDWLREHHQLNLHLSDQLRISAQLTHADDEQSAGKLLDGLRDLVKHMDELPRAAVRLPSPSRMRLEQVMSPRDAFFAETEQVPVEQAAGRVSAEMLTPYPPGVPAVVPGERLTHEMLTYLRSGVDAGMVVPDSVDSDVKSVRVVAS